MGRQTFFDWRAKVLQIALKNNIIGDFGCNSEKSYIFAPAYLQGRVKFPIGGDSPRAKAWSRDV